MKATRKILILLAVVPLLFVFAQNQGSEGEEAVVIDGQAVYMASCAGCHGPSGEGQPERIPALANHAPHLFNADGGREYLMHVLMYGLSGEITVLGETFDRSMPPRYTLSDEELAAILNHVLTSWGNEDLLNAGFEPYTPEEFSAVRRVSRNWAIQFRPAIDPEL